MEFRDKSYFDVGPDDNDRSPADTMGARFPVEKLINYARGRYAFGYRRSNACSI